MIIVKFIVEENMIYNILVTNMSRWAISSISATDEGIIALSRLGMLPYQYNSPCQIFLPVVN